MRINQLVKTLFAAMVLSASLFTACDNSGDEVVTPPTVGVTKGEATATSLTFEIKAVDADKVSYMLYLATESTPEAETIFASGKDVTNMVPVVMTETELTPETEYAIIAAASNKGGAVVSTPIVMTTLKAPEEVKNPELTLVAGDGAEYEAAGGEGAIEYEIKNGVDGTELKAEADAAWVTDVKVVAAESKVTYKVSANDKSESRSAKITLSYGELKVEATVKQKPYVEEGKPALSLKSEAKVNFTAEGGAGVIEYELINPDEETTLSATTAAEWVKDVTVVSADSKVTFNVEANATFEARESKIVVAYGDLKFEVSVSQEAKAKPELTLKSEAVKEFTAEGGNGEFAFELKNAVDGTELKAEAGAAWVTDVTVVSADSKVTYKVAANESEDARETKVTLSYGDLKVEVAVKQAGVESEEPEATLTIKSGAELSFEAAGGDGVVEYLLENATEGAEVKASTEAAWISDVKVVAADSKVTFKVAANDTTEAREAKVVLSCGELKAEATVKQAGVEVSGDYTLEITEGTPKLFEAEGGNGQFVYKVENPVEGVKLTAKVEGDATWLTIGEITDSVVNYAVAANDSEEDRQVYVTLTYGNATAEARVKQLGKEPEFVAEDITFTTAELVRSSDGIIEIAFGNAQNQIMTVAFKSSEKKYLAAETYYPHFTGDNIYIVVGTFIEVGGTRYEFNQEKNTQANTIVVELAADDTYTFTFNNLLFGTDFTATGTWSGKIEGLTQKEEEPENPSDFEPTHVVSKWMWGDYSSVSGGKYYNVSSDNLSMQVHFCTDVAQENSIVAGEYIWKSTTFISNSTPNVFSTRSVNIDGGSVAIDGGDMSISVSGDSYTINMTLTGGGNTYKIQYVGKLNDEGSQGGEGGGVVGNDVALTYFTYSADLRSNYYGYLFHTGAEGVEMGVAIGSKSASPYSISAGDYIYAQYPEDGAYSFQLRGMKINGVALNDTTDATMNVAVSGATYTITIKTNGYTFTYNGELQ